MNYIRIFLISNILFLCHTIAMAQESCVNSNVLSLDECVSMALKENKKIKSAEWRAVQYEHTKQALKANYFPNISAQFIDLYSTVKGDVKLDIAGEIKNNIADRLASKYPFIASRPMTQHILEMIPQRLGWLNPAISYEVGNVMSGSLQLVQPIYMGGKISAGYRMGKLGKEMATLGVRLSEEEVVVEVHTAYSLLVKAKEMRVVAEKFDSLINNLMHRVESAVKHGMAKQSDLMKVKVAKNQAILQLRQAENGIKLAGMNLCQIIGMPLDSEFDVEPLVNDAEVSGADKDADITGRPEYSFLEMKSQLALEKKKLEKSNFMPQVGVAVVGGVLDGTKIADQKLFNRKLNANIILSVNIPIYHAGEAKHKIRAAEAERQQAILEQQELTEKMRLQLQMTANELDECLLETELNKEALAEAEENLRLSEKAYSVGMETLTEHMVAQTMWQHAYAQLVNSRHQLVLKSIEWKKAAGRLNQ